MSEEAVKRYCQRDTLSFGKQIGFGIQGRVFTVLGREGAWITAVKIFDDEAPFERELTAYFPPFDQAWHADKESQFGSEDWPEILAAVRELESYGIFQTDASPSNIALPKGKH